MIRECNEYQIYFTREDIRNAAGDLKKVNGSWKWVAADLTDEQCDAIAEKLTGLFDGEFYKNVKAEV